MSEFLLTMEIVPEGMGFSLFSRVHILWLSAFVLTAAGSCIAYRKLPLAGKRCWKMAVAVLLILGELFKFAILLIGRNFTWAYLPLHLCSINLFLIMWHVWKPSEMLGNFLYTVCIPGALAALLFPSWTSLPASSGLHIHSFIAHILLASYPIVLTAAGEIKPKIRLIPYSLLLLVCLAVPVYGLNLLLGANFMFLMRADPGNPLYWFAQHWGSHLLGFPVIIGGVLLVMYAPVACRRKRKE